MSYFFKGTPTKKHPSAACSRRFKKVLTNELCLKNAKKFKNKSAGNLFNYFINLLGI